MREIFRLHKTWISEDLQTASEDCQRFRKTAEDNQRCRKIFGDFKTEPTINLQRIFNQSRAFILKSSEDVLFAENKIEYLFTISQFFKQLHLLLSVRHEKYV